MKKKEILLSEIELKHLKYLRTIIDYGAARMEEVNVANLNHLQSYLVFNHTVVNNYSEAVYILCKDARPHGAFVILRSLYEAHINSEYIQIGDADRKLALFAREGFYTRQTIANEFERFVKKYPKKRGSISVLQEGSISSLKIFAAKYISDINIANKLTKEDKYPDLLTKSREIDNNVSGDDKGLAELYYHLVYRFLSPYAHLNAWGLEMFIHRNPDNSINLDLGQTEKVHLIIAQVYLYYYDSLESLFKHKILNGELPRKYINEYEEIKNSKVE